MKLKTQNSKLKTIIICLVGLGLVLPSVGLAQMPQTLGEAQSFGSTIIKKLPDAVKQVWEREALPLWQGMWRGFLSLWDRTIGPTVESWWHKFLGLLGKQVEQRKPGLKEEYQKEKEEMQQDLWKELGQRFKELIK